MDQNSYVSMLFLTGSNCFRSICTMVMALHFGAFLASLFFVRSLSEILNDVNLKGNDRLQ